MAKCHWCAPGWGFPAPAGAQFCPGSGGETGNKPDHGRVAWSAPTPWLHCTSSLLAQSPDSPDLAFFCREELSLQCIFHTACAGLAGGLPTGWHM